MHKPTTLLLLAMLGTTGVAHAENPQYQQQIEAMKAQWQSGIPVAGAVALQSMQPKPKLGQTLAKQLDQAIVAARPKLAATPSPDSNQL